MNNASKVIATLAFSLAATTGMADADRDCLLEGTVQKGSSSGDQNVSVKFHSAEKYDQDSSCRIRRGEKLEFKLPADPRLQEADPGSPVKYRYQTDGDGSAKTELISVGT